MTTNNDQLDSVERLMDNFANFNINSKHNAFNSVNDIIGDLSYLAVNIKEESLDPEYDTLNSTMSKMGSLKIKNSKKHTLAPTSRQSFKRRSKKRIKKEPNITIDKSLIKAKSSKPVYIKREPYQHENVKIFSLLFCKNVYDKLNEFQNNPNKISLNDTKKALNIACETTFKKN